MRDAQADPVWPDFFEGHVKSIGAERGYEISRSGELDAAVARRSFSVGLRLASSGRVSESDRAFADAEELAGPQAWARRQRATVFLQRAMQVEAARDLEMAGRVAPEEPAARNELAWLLANRYDGRVREPERAERIARELLADWPEQGEIWTTLGLAQYRQGKWQEATQSLQTASQFCLHRRARVHLILAMAQARLGLMQEAEQSMKQAGEFWDEFEYEQEHPSPLTVDGTERLREETERLLSEIAP